MAGKRQSMVGLPEFPLSDSLLPTSTPSLFLYILRHLSSSPASAYSALFSRFWPTMALSDYLVTDDLTIILGLVAAGLFLLHNLYKPQSLVHPILLGRQSDVARVRHPGESAVYRNYGTGMMGRVSVCLTSP